MSKITLFWRIRERPRPLIFVNKLRASVRGSLELLRISICNPHICDNDALPPTRPGQFTCHPTSANHLLCWMAANRRQSGWPGPVRTHLPATATYDVCRHVLPGQMRDTVHAVVGRAFSFQLASVPWIECSVLPLSLLPAWLCVVCNTIRLYFAMKLGPDVEELKFNHRLWTLVPDALKFVNMRCATSQSGPT